MRKFFTIDVWLAEALDEYKLTVEEAQASVDGLQPHLDIFDLLSGEWEITPSQQSSLDFVLSCTSRLKWYLVKEGWSKNDR